MAEPMRPATPFAVCLVALASLATLPGETIDEITEGCLGYPVPSPVDSLTPIAGFRSYDSLVMRFDSFWLDASVVDRFRVGESVHGRRCPFA